jgi:hypothetical protein
MGEINFTQNLLETPRLSILQHGQDAPIKQVHIKPE